MEVKIKQAEVVLKKTKVTKSILIQSKTIPFKEVNVNSILGWVSIDNKKVVISYDSTNNVINKSRFINDASIERFTSDNVMVYLKLLDDSYRDKTIFDIDYSEFEGCFFVNIKSYKLVSKVYKFDIYSEAEEFMFKIKAYMDTCNIKGQFYV